jgi:hypothetical protein
MPGNLEKKYRLIAPRAASQAASAKNSPADLLFDPVVYLGLNLGCEVEKAFGPTYHSSWVYCLIAALEHHTAWSRQKPKKVKGAIGPS